MKSLCFALVLMIGLPSLAQQVCDTRSYPLSSPTSRFDDNGDGTVTDKESRLMWTRCSAGQRLESGGCVGDPNLLDWKAAQELAASVNSSGALFYNDWRVPQLRELAAITERQCQNPRVNLAVFPQTPGNFYWTSSSRAGKEFESQAYGLSFGPEGVKLQPKDLAFHVRLVRNAK